MPVAAHASTAVEGFTYGSEHVTCSAGNFKGEANISWASDGSRTRVEIQSYRITRLNGQAGGDKANINISAESYWENWLMWDYRWDTHYSPDRMIQDGRWHTYGAGLVANSHPMLGPLRTPTNIEFIFDKSGSDPRCTTSTIRVG